MTGPRKYSRITGAEREHLASALREKYEKGATMRELTKMTGRSYGFIHQVLTDAGVTPRGRGGNTRPTRT